MAINIALQARRDVDPDNQPIPRRFVGYDPKLGDEQLWNANRGAYDLDDFAATEQFATFSYDGTIRLVAELEGIENVDDEGTPRKALLGRLLRRGDPVRDALVGRQVDTDREVSHIDTTEQDEITAAERYATPERARRTFLLTIDPEMWFWTPEDEQEVITRTAAGAPVREVWYAGGRRQGIEPGDRVFLLQHGRGDRGVRGHGVVSSRVYQGEHWDDPSRMANYIDVDWHLVVPAEQMVAAQRLVVEVPGYGWNPQKGGVELHQPMADQLEELWAGHVGRTPEPSAPQPVVQHGWELDDSRRRAASIEARDQMMQLFAEDGWEVVETNHEMPYCAVAYRGEESRFLFAKGVETVGRPVLLTAEEVQHAQEHPGECLLGQLGDADFQGSSVVPGSGVLTVTPLDLEAHPVEPVLFRYEA
ncbi:hypothetical protein [Luteococcus peritonei]|uniref:Uncharacterized protein n=1 Tax=Luteococcus peritonei TaxID=88874 RepID=A0ABW4RUJ0_9ACTN